MDFVRELGVLALGSRLRRLSDRIMASGQQVYRMTEIDFEPRWFPVYRLLADHGAQTVGDCARQLGLTHAAVSQTAAAMSKRGITTSREDSEDARRRLLELTDKGRSLLPLLSDIWSDIEASIRDVVEYGGVDILAALEGIEQALTVQSLSERASEHRAARLMDAVEIIDFEPALGEHFRDLNVEWLEKYFEVEPVDREVLWNPERIIEDGGVILFARINETIVGTCAILKQKEGWELSKMAVTARYQGRKIGKALMLATLERARSMGIETLFLITNSTLTPAISMYRKMGFRVTQSGQHPKYQRGDLMMEMSL
ncbi:MAG: bifunctional helix-turn-helix transcriptional regulator/GNAT family N-acetyltransferase [Kofleriaceae bacterium]|nr:bifunctional helix-turn-helix transcriptional regulator/GNAT family N-acetyltransferase [Kofleriaceae bacterium]